MARGRNQENMSASYIIENNDGRIIEKYDGDLQFNNDLLSLVLASRKCLMYKD